MQNTGNSKVGVSFLQLVKKIHKKYTHRDTSLYTVLFFQK